MSSELALFQNFPGPSPGNPREESKAKFDAMKVYEPFSDSNIEHIVTQAITNPFAS